jgi:spore germination protein YaaH
MPKSSSLFFIRLLAIALSVTALAAATPTFTAAPSGPVSDMTINVDIQVADGDVGKVGSYYVAASYQGHAFVDNGGGWSAYDGSNLPAFAQGALQNTTLKPIQSVNLSALAGVQLYAGYGTSASDMLVNHKYAAIYTVPAAPAYMVLGYYTGDSDSLASATAQANPITAVSMDQVNAGADGSLTGAPTPSLLVSDNATAKASFICISNFGATDFDPAIGHGALVTNRAAFEQSIVALAQSQQVTGINIDFEGIYATDRDAYTSFVADLAARLHAIKVKLMLSVPAKTSDDPNNSWSWPYNLAALGQSADLLQVMTYDENVPGWAPGPVAGSDWMQASLQFAVSQVPASKILLGLPAYGYDWNANTSAGNSIAWKDIPALIASTDAKPQWDAATNSAWFNYTAGDGSPHQVWYENTQGIQLKTRFARSMGLAGVSMWALGDEDSSFWAAVSAGLNQ